MKLLEWEKKLEKAKKKKVKDYCWEKTAHSTQIQSLEAFCK